MKAFFASLLILLIIPCSLGYAQNGQLPFVKPTRDAPYRVRKEDAYKLQVSLKEKYDSGRISEDSVGRVFSDYLVNKLIPYWYGTKWDFEGHTDVPGKGEIACGYFVSTTLNLDYGLEFVMRGKRTKNHRIWFAKHSGSMVKNRP
ncbi:hypothetical protein RCC89_02925 [Cytophagaceae bacterium ABcell3]|nr:hypothetical protein RCC89_02925 [Cytophagaceae bacterium ABcell3]